MTYFHLSINLFRFFLFGFAVFMVSCSDSEPEKKIELPGLKNDSLLIPSVLPLKIDTAKKISILEQLFLDSGLVDVRTLDSNILVDLKYSTEKNFLGKDLYGDLSKCYLHPEVARKLLKAQQLLKKENPGYNLLVFDGVRPRRIQWKMWEMLDMSDKEKIKYVSNPKFGSLHNFGAAVDLSIADSLGNELEMGTPFDFFGELAYPVSEKKYLLNGKLSFRQVENRKLLRKVMHGAGFFNIQTEWWHFNSCYRKEAIKKYKLIE